MYGLIGKMTAAPGKRDELVSICWEVWPPCPVVSATSSRRTPAVPGWSGTRKKEIAPGKWERKLTGGHFCTTGDPQNGQSRGRLFRTGRRGVLGFGADEVNSTPPKSTRCGTPSTNVFSVA